MKLQKVWCPPRLSVPPRITRSVSAPKQSDNYRTDHPGQGNNNIIYFQIAGNVYLKILCNKNHELISLFSKMSDFKFRKLKISTPKNTPRILTPPIALKAAQAERPRLYSPSETLPAKRPLKSTFLTTQNRLSPNAASGGAIKSKRRFSNRLSPNEAGIKSKKKGLVGAAQCTFGLAWTLAWTLNALSLTS